MTSKAGLSLGIRRPTARISTSVCLLPPSGRVCSRCLPHSSAGEQVHSRLCEPTSSPPHLYLCRLWPWHRPPVPQPRRRHRALRHRLRNLDLHCRSNVDFPPLLARTVTVLSLELGTPVRRPSAQLSLFSRYCIPFLEAMSLLEPRRPEADGLPHATHGLTSPNFKDAPRLRSCTFIRVSLWPLYFWGQFCDLHLFSTLYSGFLMSAATLELMNGVRGENEEG